MDLEEAPVVVIFVNQPDAVRKVMTRISLNYQKIKELKIRLEKMGLKGKVTHHIEVEGVDEGVGQLLLVHVNEGRT